MLKMPKLNAKWMAPLNTIRLSVPPPAVFIRSLVKHFRWTSECTTLQFGRTNEISPAKEFPGCASVAHSGSGVPGKEQKENTSLRLRLRLA
jgi:hypothetical protein